MTCSQLQPPDQDFKMKETSCQNRFKQYLALCFVFILLKGKSSSHHRQSDSPPRSGDTEELPQRILRCFETTHLRGVRHTTPGGGNQMLVRARWRALHGLSPLKPQPRNPSPTPANLNAHPDAGDSPLL